MAYSDGIRMRLKTVKKKSRRITAMDFSLFLMLFLQHQKKERNQPNEKSQVTQILPTPTPFYSCLMEIRQSDERNAEKKLANILMMADIKRETMLE